ncbi:MAG: LysR family transcriptional regulator [Aeromonas veronii]
MDVRTLRAFVAVFEERNITAAATRLFITQPTPPSPPPSKHWRMSWG